MKLKIKAKAFVGCLMASLLFSTPLLATGAQLSLAGVSNVNKESLKAYVEKVLDRSYKNSILFSEIYLLMYKEILYVSLTQNCTEGLCSYNKDEVDAVLDENIERATNAVYYHQLKKGATKDGRDAWVEKNLCSKGCDYLNILKDSFKSIKVITGESTCTCMINVDYDSRIAIIFGDAGKILGFQYREVDAHHKYDVEYTITHGATTIKASESTSREDLSDSTEDQSVPGGMVTNFEVTATLGDDGNVIKKAGKIYVYNKLLSCRGYQFELEDDTLSSAVNGDYVSIDEFSDDGDYVSIDEFSGNGYCSSIDELSDDEHNVSIYKLSDDVDNNMSICDDVPCMKHWNTCEELYNNWSIDEDVGNWCVDELVDDVDNCSIDA